MSLIRNPTIPLLMIKVLLIVVAIVFTILFIIGIADGSDIDEALGMAIQISLIAVAIILPLGVAGYLIYAAMMGWKYCVLFELDEEGVLHAQQEAQVKKAGIIADIAVLAGLAAGNPTTVGAGLLAAANTSMYTEFADVRALRAAKGRNVIYVSNNQVYVCDEDFDFVYNFIKSRCPNA